MYNNILLDTHIAIFAMSNHKELNKDFIELLGDLNNKIYVSIASIWEVAVKSIKSPDKIPVNENQFMNFCMKMEFEFLPIKTSHIKHLRNLKIKDESIIYKDPFDKMLLAQSICENLTFCTRDSVLLNYDVPNIKIV